MANASFEHWLELRNNLRSMLTTSNGALNDDGFKGADRRVGNAFAKCEGCGCSVYVKELEARFLVCPSCQFHHPLSAQGRISLLAGSDGFEELDNDIAAGEFPNFDGYGEKLESARRRTNLQDAVVSGMGNIGNHRVALAAMDFRFIGGSMGSVVGERITRSIELASDEGLPLVIVSASGGARMFEGIYSLMQMAKVSVVLSRYMNGSWPFISVLTDPTFGGVTASFATAADVILAEPGARIGFAGARVIEAASSEALPEGFQTAEFQREQGVVDRIVHRLALKKDIERILELTA